jgi:hypothetical protein
MVVPRRRARLGVLLAACLAALAIAAPTASAHPEECLGGAAAWASMIPSSEENFASLQANCTPASVSAYYDTSGATLGPDETDGRNLQLVTNLPKTGALSGTANINSDLAFWGKYAFNGNYGGFQITDISNPAAPQIVSQVLCPGSQNDISVWKNLLFLSTDSSRSDDSCQSVAKPVTDPTAWEGIKVFDISDPTNPRYIKSVETKCGSHTHTLVPDGNRVLLYVSSYILGSVTGPDCQLPHDLISIVEVPLATPTSARVIAEPVLFPDGGYDGSNNYTTPTTGCHDITVYRAKDLAAGACMGDGILMDISDPAKPKVIARMLDPNFAFWHSATISHDGKQVLFTDERGGGVGAECNPTVGPQRGADAVYNIRNRKKPVFLSYFKIPRTQTDTENCVAHNGNLLPIPGRDILVQAWYQGGVSVIDWTNGKRVHEIAWWDRGPWTDENGVAGLAGAWSSYWYNGRIYTNEIQRGFDVHRFTGLASLLQLVTPKLPYANAQTQEPPRLWW